jgi:PEP-CTERM motif
MAAKHQAFSFKALTAATVALAATFPAHAAEVPGQGTWQTDLSGRDLDGNVDNGFEAYYDKALNVTWLADANHAKTSGYDADGGMSWEDASAWASQLDVGGVTGWRLPQVQFSSCYTGGSYLQQQCGYYADPSASEMAHMFFVTLGNKSNATSTPSALAINTGPFANVKDSWGSSFNDWVSGVKGAWVFNFNSGYQNADYTFNPHNAWAIHDGDVGSVPEPQTYALMGLGLLAVGAALRQRKQAV